MIKKGIREDDPNSCYFTLPGGKLESEEKGLKSVEGRIISAKRETKSETGIDLKHLILIGTILFNNQDRTFKNWKNPEDFLVYIFKANSGSGRLKENDGGIPYWKSISELKNLPQNPGDKLMYSWIKTGKKFFGVIKHNGNEIDYDGTWVDFF
jgi:ADP-ribose pyrophosphatase YjhB (NUDIX family)